MSEARAVARANIALAKYWGKCDGHLNLPATPSLSLTLDGLVTETWVRFGSVGEDRVSLDGRPATPREHRRVVALLDEVRTRAGLRARAEVRSENRFPTAAGLASSASGFAALAGAAAAAADLRLGPKVLSALARRASASAARSVFGGFAQLRAGTPGDDRLHATQVAPESHWDVRLVVAITSDQPKAVGSREAMERARRSSPLYAAWLAAAPALCRTIKRAVVGRDLPRLGAAMEQSTMAFHATAMTSTPPVHYFEAGTMAALHAVEDLRARGVSVYATLDAGPHVKALCRAEDAERVRRALRRCPGVLRTRILAPGPGLAVQR